jgi:MOSC domain-containing protein YiiM
MEIEHLSEDQIEAGMPAVFASPQNRGQLEAIVVRPESDKRETREAVYLSPEGGVEGDRWASSKAQDGGPEPCAQVSLMNGRLLRMIAKDDERIPLAGDNLIVDLDLSEANLPIGQRLTVGEVLMEITDLPHTGCSKFAERFGTDALRYINAAERRSLRLRGLFARVLKAGTVQVGDAVQKID